MYQELFFKKLKESNVIPTSLIKEKSSIHSISNSLQMCGILAGLINFGGLSLPSLVTENKSIIGKMFLIK